MSSGRYPLQQQLNANEIAEQPTPLYALVSLLIPPAGCTATAASQSVGSGRLGAEHFNLQ
ncbi:hypothetical protein PF003_g32515 [Phytophthora fragariae]|nr:hypothetical protein PF003_g32515 [Phytophthora fragariae]